MEGTKAEGFVFQERTVKPTFDEVSELLAYDATTGRLTWRVSRCNVKAGSAAGTSCKDGYVRIRILGTSYGAHRVCWLLAHGQWPTHDVDHINGDRADNRLLNLRDVPRGINLQNQRRATSQNKSSRLLGAHYFKPANLWRSRIVVRGVSHDLGYFKTSVEAQEAYVAAKRRLHEGCTL